MGDPFSFVDIAHAVDVHTDLFTPDGQSEGSMVSGAGGLHLFDSHGAEIASTEHFALFDQILDAHGKEVASIDHAGNVWHEGRVEAHVADHGGTEVLESANGQAILEVHADTLGQQLTTPAGAAVLLLRDRFGIV